MKIQQTLLVLAASTLCAAALADTDGAAKTATSKAPSDATFVKTAAEDGLTEVALGKIALDKSQDSGVKSFAQHMVDDHSKANDELAGIAKGKSLEVPTALDAKHQKIVDAMSAKSGKDFDVAYAQAMAKDHTKAVALFKRETNSSDSDLADFAKKTLPTLTDHKHMADGLNSNVRTASAGSSSTSTQSR